MIGSFLLDRILRGHHHEWRLQRIGLAVNGDLPLFHDLEQCRLRLCRRAVDLVDQNDIAENGSLLELETAFPRIENGSPDHIAGHQIRRELDTRKADRNDFAEQFGRKRLGHSRYAFDQDMAVRQDSRKQQLDHLIPARR